MPEQITITLNDNGTIDIANYEAATAWHQKTGKLIAIGVTDNPETNKAFMEILNKDRPKGGA